MRPGLVYQRKTSKKIKERRSCSGPVQPIHVFDNCSSGEYTSYLTNRDDKCKTGVMLYLSGEELEDVRLESIGRAFCGRWGAAGFTRRRPPLHCRRRDFSGEIGPNPACIRPSRPGVETASVPRIGVRYRGGAEKIAASSTGRCEK